VNQARLSLAAAGRVDGPAAALTQKEIAGEENEILLAIGAQCIEALTAGKVRPGEEALGAGAALGHDTVKGRLATIERLVAGLDAAAR
jgi:hypothetical protein